MKSPNPLTYGDPTAYNAAVIEFEHRERLRRRLYKHRLRWTKYVRTYGNSGMRRPV